MAVGLRLSRSRRMDELEHLRPQPSPGLLVYSRLEVAITLLETHFDMSQEDSRNPDLTV